MQCDCPEQPIHHETHRHLSSSAHRRAGAFCHIPGVPLGAPAAHRGGSGRPDPERSDRLFRSLFHGRIDERQRPAALDSREPGLDPARGGGAVPGAAARHWLDDISGFTAFHWHGETFSVPAGADRLLASAHCPNQAFALGPHLALQCHVEMTSEMIAEWARHGAGEIARRRPQDAIQTGEEMCLAATTHLPEMQAVAERLYGLRLEGLARY